MIITLDKEPEKVEEVTVKAYNVQSINSIKEKHKDIRQASKSPTFALTYMGTWITLVKNCGMTEEDAKRVEEAYHTLYKESDEYVKNQVEKACHTGYVEGAFGLKCRTPMLRQSILGLKVTPREVQAESRTAGNMLSQSYGMLTVRALIAFMDKVRHSKYKYSILPANIIHDALYFLVRDDADTILWFNEHIVKEFKWQEEPKIKHDKVHLGGEVSIFYPDWAHELTLPNELDKDTLRSLVQAYIKSLEK